jgi:organic hydroperoxide reductase OsmC/OhrA
VVVGYEDRPRGVMVVGHGGLGSFREVTLRPSVTVEHPAMVKQALELHPEAHRLCFIARSVNFPVSCRAQVGAGERGAKPEP